MGIGGARTIDDRLARELSGSAKIAALLKAHGYTYQRLAQEHGFWPAQVKLCIYGNRAYPAVRNILAQVLDLPRAEIDSLLDVARATDEAA
jgi:lambda repressor-like predicted transcriptional regulator